MLNLNKELESLKSLSDNLKSITEKTEVEISKVKGDEKNILLSFISDIKESVKTGEGLNKIIENIKNYDSNR